MESEEDLVAELRALTPAQLDRVARIVHELACDVQPATARSDGLAPLQPGPVPPPVLDLAIQNGWPVTLFSEVIGRIDADFKRAPQPPYEARHVL